MCWVEVTAGEGELSDVGQLERDTLELLSSYIRRTRTVRLACQARVVGDVEVRKPGVRPA